MKNSNLICNIIIPIFVIGSCLFLTACKTENNQDFSSETIQSEITYNEITNNDIKEDDINNNESAIEKSELLSVCDKLFQLNSWPEMGNITNDKLLSDVYDFPVEQYSELECFQSTVNDSFHFLLICKSSSATENELMTLKENLEPNIVCEEDRENYNNSIINTMNGYTYLIISNDAKSDELNLNKYL